jgi:S1-C subfamily serine protease
MTKLGSAKIAPLVGLWLLVSCGSDSALTETVVGDGLESTGFEFEQASLGVVRIEAEGCLDGSVGTGVLVDERHVVTVAHVVAGSDEIYVETETEAGKAVAIGFDEERDLALLRTDAPIGSEYLPLGDYEYQTGDPISIIGFPLGLEASLVIGVISNDEVRFDDLPLSRFVQVDAPLNPGNSGGPVFNDDGDVIGLVDWKFSDAEGLSFAISTRSIDRIVESWIGSDAVTTGECSLDLDTAQSDETAERSEDQTSEPSEAATILTVLVPDVTGRFADTAITMLRNDGLDPIPHFEQVPRGSPLAGRILSQDPAPLEEVEIGYGVVIVVGEAS